ncbi:MAG: hypothetical protein O3B01_05525 [Planctomycetota bacterium]|nr:hypothetical protein [Planctomycetota bacterium]MDA1138022.1 hypothetical protein [Planctomycetota bacterium]
MDISRMNLARSGGVILFTILANLYDGTAEEDTSKPQQRFTTSEELHRKYKEGIRLCFDWEYEKSREVFNEILKADPANPAADFLLGALTLNTIQYYDQDKTDELDKFVYDSFERSIKKADAVLLKNPNDMNAFFFKGASHGFRGIFRLQKLQIFSAASDARIAKSYMDKVIELNPEFYDAYLGLGIYNYFVDALPSLMRFMRALLFIPSGDKTKGLEQLTAASEKATYSRLYAKVVLAGLYNNFEGDYAQGRKLERGIAKECPRHPWFALERGTIQAYRYFESEAAEQAYLKIIELAKSDEHFDGEIKAVASYRLARTMYERFKPRAALDGLKRFIEELEENPDTHTKILSGAHLLAGKILKRMGRNEEAQVHLKRVLSLPDSDNYRHERMDNRIVISKQQALHLQATELMKQLMDAKRAEAYVLSTDAINALREGKENEALELLDKTFAIKGGHLLARWGMGLYQAGKGEKEQALKFLEGVASAPGPDHWLKTDARFRAALILESLGERDKALDHYRKISVSDSVRFSFKQAALAALNEGKELKDMPWPSF